MCVSMLIWSCGMNFFLTLGAVMSSSCEHIQGPGISILMSQAKVLTEIDIYWGLVLARNTFFSFRKNTP